MSDDFKGTYLVRRIPPRLWTKVKRRAEADRLSLQDLALLLFERYANGELDARPGQK